MQASNSHSVNEIDYGSLHDQAAEPEKVAEKKKAEGITSRSIKKEKNVAEAAPIDVSELAAKSNQLSKQIGEPKSPEGLTKYAPEILGGLGILGALAAAHHHYTNNHSSYGESNAGKPPEPKPDMRNIGAVAPPAPQYSPDVQAMIERSDKARADKAAEAAAKANPVPTGYPQGLPQSNPMDELTKQPPAPQLIQPKPPAGAMPPVNAAPPAPLTPPPPPAPPPAPVQTPSVGEAVATGGNVDQAIKQTVANQLDQTPVAPPKGMREQYKKSKSEPIGPGGYNWFASQVGHEQAPTRWAEQYGERNVPHSQVQPEFSQTRYPPKPNPTGEKTGGAFGAPKFIPEYIKGGATLGGMGATAAVAAVPALAAAAYHAYSGNKEKVDQELGNAWDSLKSVVTMPVDVAKAAGKGDFGPFKDMLMSLHPAAILLNETNKHDEAAIQRMIQSEKAGAGQGQRGVPPSNQR
jgi:hypothetical protein